MGPDPAVSPPRSPVPVVLPSFPCCYTCIPLLSSPDSHPLTRLDGSLVSLSLVSSSFLSPVDGDAMVRHRVCISTYLQSPFPLPLFFLRRQPSTHACLYLFYPSTFLLSKYYFLHGDKCKTKTYLFYTLCKYAGIAI